MTRHCASLKLPPGYDDLLYPPKLDGLTIQERMRLISIQTLPLIKKLDYIFQFLKEDCGCHDGKLHLPGNGHRVTPTIMSIIGDSTRIAMECLLEEHEEIFSPAYREAKMAIVCHRLGWTVVHFYLHHAVDLIYHGLVPTMNTYTEHLVTFLGALGFLINTNSPTIRILMKFMEIMMQPTPSGCPKYPCPCPCYGELLPFTDKA